MHRTTLTALLAAAAALAPGAGASAASTTSHPGTARFQVPDQRGVLHASTRAHTTFALPPGSWTQARGEMAGTPAPGSYHRDAAVTGGSCQLHLDANGRAMGSTPALRALPHTHVVAQGRSGQLRWFVGLAEGGPQPVLYATGYRPAPSFATTKRWAFFRADLSAGAGTGAPPHTCGRLRDHVDLGAVVRSMRVVRGG